jgi:RimJ/RimL family protein N-acetyltransferase
MTPNQRFHPFVDADLAKLATLNGDTEVMRYISPALSSTQVAQVLGWFESEWRRLGYGWFALFHAESAEFVGQCGLQKLEGKQDADDVEIAFVIAKSFWGQGYATEAAQAVVKFGFSTAGLNRIVAVTLEENLPSQRILGKLGFVFEENRNLYERRVMFYVLEASHLSKHQTAGYAGRR